MAFMNNGTPIPIGSKEQEEDLLKEVQESIDEANEEEENGNDDTDEE